MEFLKQKWLNKSWIAEQLWGNNNTSNTSKLSKKINGRSSFNEVEMKRLNEIKEMIKTTL